MSGLYRRDGKFAFRYKDSAGRWREKRTGKASRAEAKEFKRDFENLLAKGILPTEKATWTVEQAATRWVEQHAPHLASDRNRRNERSLLRQLTRRIGTKRLRDLTLDDLKTYQARRREEVANRTVNLELRILINVLKESNLHAPLKHYKLLRERESEVGQALSQEQLARLEATAASNPAWTVAYRAEVLAANTGLRSCEIRRLQLADVDLEQRRLRIRRQGTKTDAGARLVELNQAALEAVTRLYERAQMLGALKPEHYLLPADLSRHTKSADPLKGIGFDATHHQLTWRTAWRNLRTAANLDGLRFHTLRHTFVSMMAERNVPLPVVQAMVGHMSARMTRHYTHISTQAARAAVELLDKKPEVFVAGFVADRENGREKSGKLLN